MSSKSTKLPVLLNCYNRLKETKNIISILKRYQPKKIYVSVDGPLHDNRDDHARVSSVRQYLLKELGGFTSVEKKISIHNKGLRTNVSQAIDWFFDNESEGIILEDDCSPNISFFHYCECLLKKYRNDQRVMSICGHNYGFNDEDFSYDYFFSMYGSVWGWATWRRAWEKYDVDMTLYEKALLTGQIETRFPKDQVAYHLDRFERIVKRTDDTWDIQWIFSMIMHNGFAIIPKKNLVKNIGIGVDATHTYDDYISLPKTMAMGKKIKHPPAFFKNNYFEKFCARLLKRKKM